MAADQLVEQKQTENGQQNNDTNEKLQQRNHLSHSV